MDASNCKRTIDNLFKCAIEIERKASELYNDLATLFFHIPEIAAFWNSLFKDEIYHMQTLQTIYKSLSQEERLSISEGTVWDDIIKTQTLVNKDLIGPIRNLDDAYELTHELEFHEVNAVFQLLTNEFIPSDGHKKFVISHVKQHQKKLMDFSRNFGGRAWRKNINIL